MRARVEERWPRADGADGVRRPVGSGSQESPTRRGLYYGWVLVGVLGVTETTSWGILFYSFAVFLEPMRAELGWSRGDTSLAFSLALLASGLAAMLVGRWLDRRGPRLLMTAGSIAGTLLVLAWSRVESLAGLYVVWIAIGLAMAATLYEPAFATLARWFERQRARAFLALTLMAGLASTIFQPLAAALIAQQGWRGALVTLAAVLAVVTIPAHALLLRQGPEALGLAPDGALPPAARAPSTPADPTNRAEQPVSSWLRQRLFWWLVAAFFLNTLGSIALSVHLVPYLADRGLSLQAAATAAGAVGAMQLLGRLAFAPLEARLPERALVTGVFLAQPLAVVALLLVPGAAGVWAFIALFGAGRGAATLSRAILIGRFYGAARYGSANGALSLFTTVAQALAPITAGLGFDLAGRYEPVFWLLAGLSLVAAACALRLEARDSG